LLVIIYKTLSKTVKQDAFLKKHVSDLTNRRTGTESSVGTIQRKK